MYACLLLATNYAADADALGPWSCAFSVSGAYVAAAPACASRLSMAARFGLY